MTSLIACVPKKQAIKTQTVEVSVPTYTALPPELLTQEVEPRLAAGKVNNEDLADLIERLRVWGRTGWDRVAKIKQLQPNRSPDEN